ncbi:MAG: hypothetical protein JXB35_03955 [Anaerolineae bacterium]|nr:hypothetical protein [Anaerolineae bacterium]
MDAYGNAKDIRLYFQKHDAVFPVFADVNLITHISSILLMNTGMTLPQTVQSKSGLRPPNAHSEALVLVWESVKH